MRSTVAAALAVVAACSGDDTSGQSPAPRALEVVPGEYSLESRDLRPLSDGDDITLQLPPQGGRVAFIGAGVRGASCDQVRLTVRLAATDGTELVLDGRTVPLDPPDGTGLRKTRIETFTAQSNLRMCPDYEGRRVDDRAYDVRVEVEEAGCDRRKGTVTVRVFARCFATDEGCACLCAENYQQGSCLGG